MVGSIVIGHRLAHLDGMAAAQEFGATPGIRQRFNENVGTHRVVEPERGTALCVGVGARGRRGALDGVLNGVA